MKYAQIRELIKTSECKQMLVFVYKPNLSSLVHSIDRLDETLNSWNNWHEAMESFRQKDSFANFKVCKRIVIDALKSNFDSNLSEYEITVCTAFSVWSYN